MRRVVLGCCALAALAAVALPAIGTAADPAYAPKNCVKPKIAPGRIVVTCGDGNFYVKIREWKYFNGHSAKAKAVAHVNSCRPSCAAGTFKSYGARIYLDDTERIRCGKGKKKVKMFTEITIKYGSGHPKGTGTIEQYPLDCIS